VRCPTGCLHFGRAEAQRDGNLISWSSATNVSNQAQHWSRRFKCSLLDRVPPSRLKSNTNLA
jgi:hypothetical protein